MTRLKSVSGVWAVLAASTCFVTLVARSNDVVPVSTAPQTYDHAGYVKQVQPFFAKYCIGCHTAGGTERDVPLDVFSDQESLVKGIPNLDKAIQMLQQQKMPPKRKPQPTDSERKAAIDWLQSFTSGCDCNNPATLTPGRVTLRRLNRAEYNNTIHDLLAIDYRPADSFPVDDAGYGFDNIGDVLSMAPVLMEKYMSSAEAVMRQAIFVDPGVPPPTKQWDANIAEGSVPKTTNLSPKPTELAGARLRDADVGNGRIFYYNGEIHADYDFPGDGTYYFRVRGYSNPGANSRVRPLVQVLVDGKPLGKPINVNDEQKLTKMYASTPLKVSAGKHTITMALINNGTKEEYDAAVEAERLATVSPTTQPATQPNMGLALNAQPPRSRGRGPLPVGTRGGQLGVVGRGRGPVIPPAPPPPTGRATLGLHFFEVEGPIEPTLERMPESYRRVMVALPSTTVTKQQAAEKIIRDFATKAYRRPVTGDEVQRLLALWKSSDADGDQFEESISSTLAVVLASPHFLYHMEREPTAAEGAVRTLDEYELASRLSYFLWSSMPDEELSSLAAQGKLRENLDAQVIRMLQDPKSRALDDNFAGQWLQLRMMENVNPDPKLYPDFDAALRVAMATETQMFFDAIVKEDRSVLDFIDSDFTFLNERLARHYGIDGIKGEQFQRVQLAAGQRGGLLTQGSILTITSYPNRTSPVQRGKWVLENLLDAAPPPPPPNVPALNEETQLKGTLRQRMLQHRQNAVCASCHEQMDAIGFGLENFDAIGAWRTTDADSTIDPAGVLPNGQSFSGPAELKKIIKSQDEAFCRALANKLMTYALGRGMEKSDRCYIDPIVNKMKQNGYKFSVLVHEIVHSDPFQKRSAN